MKKPSRVWNFKMGKANLNIGCFTVKNLSRSTVPHGFGSRCVIVFLIVTAAINVAFASLTVSVDNFNVGVNATFSCVFEGTLRQLIWSKTESGGVAPNPEFILKHIVGFPVSYGADVDRTHYKFDETSNDLKVLDVTLDDDGRYWCEVRAAGFDNAENSTLASIIVPTAADTTSITYKGNKYTDGQPIVVDAGEQEIFTCISTGIKPAATFTWTPSTLSGTTTSVASKVDSRLFDSSSNVTVDIGSSLSFKQLKCKASNTDDESLDVEINVNLTLNEPAMNSSTPSSPPSNPPTADTTTSMTPQDTTTPPSSSQETTMSPTGPTETTSDIVPTSTESPTTINTGTRGSSTTPTGSSEMSTRSSEMTTGSTEMTNSTYPLTPSTTAHTPETTPTGCTTLCDEATGLSIGIIIGIVVGSLCVVVITVGVGIAILKYNSKNGVTPDSNQSKKGKKKEAIEEEHV